VPPVGQRGITEHLDRVEPGAVAKHQQQIAGTAAYRDVALGAGARDFGTRRCEA
jgi:hypothetical protein